MANIQESKRGKVALTGTVNEIKLHNSKIGDESWVDLSIRVVGNTNILASMLMFKAKEKSVEIQFDTENEQY